jgi:rare lipoprotein A
MKSNKGSDKRWRVLLLPAGLLSPSVVCSAKVTVRGPEGRHQWVQVGLASWYGPRLQGHATASGEPFDEHQLTASHPTLPLGTKVKVTNLRNGRSAIVRIIDRGPVVAHRVIDVSKAAALRLGFTHRGLTPVKSTRNPESGWDFTGFEQNSSDASSAPAEFR